MTDPPESFDGGTPGQDPAETQPRYVGLATRLLGFVIDAALIDVVAVVVGIGAALVLSVFRLPKDLHALWVAIGAAAYVIWFFGYFVAFWSGTGQTPGSRVMQLRVVSASGGRVKPVRALVRCIGLILAALPLFLGYVPILFDGKRRGLQDYLARTLVVEAPQLSIAAGRRERKRAAYEAARQPPSAVT